MEPLVRLPLSLPRRGSRQLLAALHAQLRAAILDGRLKSGMRLPSTRALAATYGISRNTVLAAFDLLLSEGYIVARRGSGTTVAEALSHTAARKLPESLARRARRLNPRWRVPSRDGATSLRVADPAGRGNAAAGDDSAQVDGAGPIGFRVGIPALDLFPYDVWRRLSARALREYRRRPDSIGAPEGLAALRSAIAQHVAFARAVSCRAEDVIVTAGAQQAFDLLARILVADGRTRIALENPGYPPLRRAFEAQGARIATVPVDEYGIVVEQIPRDAVAVCVSPSHQFPLGVVMSAQRRMALLEHCTRYGTVIIEDDYDGEFRFGERPLDALQTLDAAQSVIYVGTFSKSLLPALRLGYIVAPSWARQSLVAAKAVSDGWCNTLTQATVALMIREGMLAQHVRRMQRIYARRRKLVLDGLRDELSRWLEPIPSIAGLHLAARFKVPCVEAELAAELRREAIEVTLLRRYFAGRPTERGVMLGYGAIAEQDIVAGLGRLQRALRRVARS